MLNTTDLPLPKAEFAHYYGDWLWKAELTDWVKSLLLFFDGIALGIPDDTADQLIESDPVLAQPLAELGLLRNYWPEVSQEIQSRLSAGYVEQLLRMGEVLERIPEGETLSASDLRSIKSAFTSAGLGEALENFGLKVYHAKQTFGDAPSNTLALTVAGVSRFLIQHVTDVSIQPVIENENAASYVAAIIDSHDEGYARIIVGDLSRVGINLDTVPLDEVLDFRRQHGSAYRAYTREVRQFVLEKSLLSKVDQSYALMDRCAALNDRAEELRRIGRAAFKRQVISLGFGITGAAWTLVHGDPWAAAFTAGAAAAGLSAPSPGPIGAAYTYILEAKAQLRR